MRNFILGFILGSIVFGTLAWAATRATLEGGNGVELGTTANPIIVELI